MDYAKHLRTDLPSARILLVLFVPDLDRDERPIDHDHWVSAALELFGRLFRGATAFPRGRGVWRDDARGGRLLFEQPTIIHCYTEERFITAGSLHELGAFMRTLGRETNQGEVGMIVDGQYWGMKNFDV
jgi:hypothetical protein